MLLVEFTINAIVFYVSIDGHGLTHNYRPLITNFDAPVKSIPSDHGGFAKMEFGSITFNPILFISDWPPPINGDIKIYYSDTTEAARELVFEGTAHLTNFDRESVSYALYGPSYDETMIIRGVGPLETGRWYKITDYIADDDFINVGAASNATGVIFQATGTTPTKWTNFSKLAPYWNDTLNVVLTDILSQIAEITTVDTTYARASSPNVIYTLTSERLAINVASDIAEFYSHLIYIVGDTAYIVDMLLTNGADWSLTEFDFFAFPSYQYKTPISTLNCSLESVIYTKTSDYPYGVTTTVDPYHITQANIESALTNILLIENAPRITNFKVPMITGNFPRMGQKVSFIDTSHICDFPFYFYVRKMTYDFLECEINIEGDGC